MAQWKETLEPYVKVIESVKTAALNPTAGGDLILGAVIISDSGPSEPTLITSQSEFLEIYASEELTKDYIKSLDSLYSSDRGSALASTMWLNAYRLAGSASLLVSRASKANGVIYTKPLDPEDDYEYIIKDSEILKRVTPFKFVIDKEGASQNGWAVAVNEVGVIGNLVDDNGPRYDYFAESLMDLVDKLEETSKFYSPDYAFYSDEKCTIETKNANEAVAVLFNEVYLGSYFLDSSLLTDETISDDLVNFSSGLAYIFAAEREWAWADTQAVGNNQDLFDLNSEEGFSGFEPFKNYVSNLYNTRSNLEIRIRRFNHNAVKANPTDDPENSPWTVDASTLKTYIEDQKRNENAASLYYDFFEFQIVDPSISEEPIIFNIGNLPGRGDVTVEEMRNAVGMIYFDLPEDLHELRLNYYGYDDDNNVWAVEASGVEASMNDNGESIIYGGEEISLYASTDNFPETIKGTKAAIEVTIVNEDGTSRVVYDIYAVIVNPDLPYEEIEINLGINDNETALLNVSEGDILKAWDRIEEDERYVVEGFCDLGNTYPAVQSYVANIAINSNYFYAFSTANATNYMTISNKAQKIGKKSHKLYAAAPWDYDDGTVGFQFAVSPSVLYWEAVMRNRQNNNEFAGVFGQNTGRVNVMNLAKEFKKSERQLLLSKKINTISYDNYLGSYYFNDNYTYTEDSHVMSEECNSRLQIRISKAMPILLCQFKSRQNTSKTWKEMRETINFWFINTIMNYNYTIAEYRIICDETNNKPETIRQNKVFVTIQVRFNSSIKFITVYNDAYPIGVEFSE